MSTSSLLAYIFLFDHSLYSSLMFLGFTQSFHHPGKDIIFELTLFLDII